MGSDLGHLKQFKAWRKDVRRKIKFASACRHRKALDSRTTFVGITGSAGKSSTTDLVIAILSGVGLCQQTHQHNDLGAIVKMILATERRHRFCVAELGAHGPETLDKSICVFKPDIGVVTVVGRDHFSAYRSLEKVAAEKAKMISALPARGVAVLNVDDPLVQAMGAHFGGRVIWFGAGEGAELRLIKARSRWPERLTLQIEHDGTEYEVRTRFNGEHMAVSVMASLGVALAAGVSLESAVRTISGVKPIEGRMEAADGGGGVWFIRDDYKAPGWTFAAAMKFLGEADATRKVAVVGTISDTTGDSTRNYKRFCRQAREVADLVVFVGSHAHRALRARRDESDASIQGFSSIRQAAVFLQKELRAGDLVMLKGSTGADHLGRIFYNRSTPVRCWRDRCGKGVICSACPELYASTGEDIPAPLTPLPPGTGVPVIVGLGNPGVEYGNTAHNAGHRVLDALALACGGVWEECPEGLESKVTVGADEVLLLKPGSFINNSGPPVRQFLERVGGATRLCTLVHDDADLPLGEIRESEGGGDAGHKGVRSIISALETVETPRLRLGVRPTGDVAIRPEHFVIAKLSPDESAAYTHMVEMASTRLRERLSRGANGSVDQTTRRRDSTDSA